MKIDLEGLSGLWRKQSQRTRKLLANIIECSLLVGRHILSGTFMLIGIFHTSPAHVVEVLSQAVKQITAEQRPQLLSVLSADQTAKYDRTTLLMLLWQQCKLTHVSGSHEFPCPPHVPRLLIYPHKYGDKEGHRFGHN